MPLDQLKEHFTEIVSAGYSVSLFTDWRSESINEVWIKDIVNPEIEYRGIKEFYGAKAAEKDLHPIIELSAENCTPQMGKPGPWYERLPHLKWVSHPAAGRNCNQNISYHGNMPWKLSWPFRKWVNKSVPICL